MDRGEDDDVSDHEGAGTSDGAGDGRHPADETVRSESLPETVRCPHCGEEDSEQFSSFGSAVSVSQYYCRSCRTVFEAFKWR